MSSAKSINQIYGFYSFDKGITMNGLQTIAMQWRPENPLLVVFQIHLLKALQLCRTR